MLSRPTSRRWSGRHPHVFGDEKVETDKEVLANWEEIKKKEKGYEERRSILEGIPRSMPALIQAHRLQERAARVGFDWNRIDEALPKLDEEIAEFKESLKTEERGKDRGRAGRHLLHAREPVAVPRPRPRRSAPEDHQQVHQTISVYRRKRRRRGEVAEGHDAG